MRPGNYFRGAGTQNSIPVVFLDSLHRVSHSNTQASSFVHQFAFMLFPLTLSELRYFCDRTGQSRKHCFNINMAVSRYSLEICRGISTTIVCHGKRNFRKFPLYNKRGTKLFKKEQSENPDPDLFHGMYCDRLGLSKLQRRNVREKDLTASLTVPYPNSILFPSFNRLYELHYIPFLILSLLMQKDSGKRICVIATTSEIERMLLN
ncbi:hypothetical protein ANN_20293 [Periplaneta americana]|uniref:Uncharacterized protein n=1 Tax=Periplaneta americana TaxID=6978 RepID=A0ABQ8SDD1_PERAM|nr:hypothetical protein ANN_20293 [Periplaneta americana]